MKLTVPIAPAVLRAVFGLIALAAFLPRMAAQQNLLQNGSFESSTFTTSSAQSGGIGYVSVPPGGDQRGSVPNWTWTADPAAAAYSGALSSTFALNRTGGALGE